MDSYRDPRHDNDHSGDEPDEISGLVPIPNEERHAPPVDIDEREHRDAPSAPIELPAHDTQAGDVTSDRIGDRIDELLPLPTDEEHHDDDTVAPDPFDVNDQVDLHMPRPSGSGETRVDDFSTSEEWDVDNAPAERSDTFDQGGESPPIALHSPGEDDPINTESDFYALTYDDDMSDDAAAQPDTRTPFKPPTGASGPATSPLPPPNGTTTCPVCGRQTDALRFCGYCGAQLTAERPTPSSSTLSGRIQERAQILLNPLADWTRPGTVRLIMAVGALLVLVSLLANTGAMALIFGSAILPLILVFWCLNNDVFENESPVIIAGFGLGGVLLGAILGWLGSLVVASSWFETGVLNYGAAGFGGEFAERAGSPPFLVWTLVGIVFPLLALAAIIGGPLAMRQTISLRNEVMDGLTLGAVTGAGYALGTAIVFAAPMLTQGGPVADASTWTLTTIGLAVIRPLIWTLCGGMLGAAAWRYLLTGRIGSVLIPATIGAAAPLLFTLMSIELSATGLWPEIIWGVIVAAIVGLFYRRTMDQAVREDRKVLGTNDSRVICPVCHQVTPTGQFCAHCGAELG